MTFAGQELRKLGAFVHSLVGGPITPDTIISAAGDIAGAANYYTAVKTACAGITDPVALGTAVCKSLVANKGLLPASLQGDNFVEEAVKVASEITNLDPVKIEAELKTMM